MDLKTDGLRLSGLNDNHASLPFRKRLVWKREKGSIDNACDDSDGVAAVLEPLRAYEFTFINTSMPGVIGFEVKLRQYEGEFAANDNGDHQRLPSHYSV